MKPGNCQHSHSHRSKYNFKKCEMPPPDKQNCNITNFSWNSDIGSKVNSLKFTTILKQKASFHFSISGAHT